MLDHDLGHRAQAIAVVVLPLRDPRAVRLEPHLLEDPDLCAAQDRLGAAVLLRIRIGASGLVRTGVGLVRDPVVVAVRVVGAAVVLRVLARRTDHVRAGVFFVDHPVVVAVGGAAVLLLVGLLDARAERAGVFCVRDSVLIGVRRAPKL